MDIKSLDALRQVDERTLRFAPLRLALGGMMQPEDAAVFSKRRSATRNWGRSGRYPDQIALGAGRVQLAGHRWLRFSVPFGSPTGLYPYTRPGHILYMPSDNIWHTVSITVRAYAAWSTN